MLQCNGPLCLKYCIRVSIGTCHIPSKVSRNFLLTESQDQTEITGKPYPLEIIMGALRTFRLSVSNSSIYHIRPPQKKVLFIYLFIYLFFLSLGDTFIPLFKNNERHIAHLFINFKKNMLMEQAWFIESVYVLALIFSKACAKD